MENQLQTLNNTHHYLIALNGKEIEIAKVIYHVNQLTSYPLSAVQIEDWSKTINELRPNQDVWKLKTIINMMKMGDIKYDSRLGIQNIFSALKEYDKIKIGYIKKVTYDSYMRGGDETEIVEYYEGEEYPKDMIWLVDKVTYENSYLKPTVPERNHFLEEL